MEYCEVLTIIQSRAFVLKINQVKCLSLVPFADMYNHRYPIQNKFYYDNEKGGMIMESIEDIPKGA